MPYSIKPLHHCIIFRLYPHKYWSKVWCNVPFLLHQHCIITNIKSYFCQVLVVLDNKKLFLSSKTRSYELCTGIYNCIVWHATLHVLNSYQVKGEIHMSITNNDIDEALRFFDTCDMACKLTPTVTLSSGYGRGHTMMIDLIDFIID